jgi:hypothetical protein
MSNHKNLVFFNKEGDALNVNYSNVNDRFEADLMFDENSSDTYKTYGIYTMEKIPSFDYELPGELTLEKFQLFNEWGFHFYGSPTQSIPILGLEPINNDPSFYSKWVYGNDIEAKLPIGSIITFETKFLEYNNPEKTYVVVGNKKGAIMIISEVDNATFERNFFADYNDTNNFYTLDVNNNPIYKNYVRGINAVGIYNYIDSTLQNNLSSWSEPNFYDRFYLGQKLNIVKSGNNDGTVTVKDLDLTDPVSFEYWATGLPTGKDLIIEYTSKTDLPILYDGGVTITAATRSGEGKIELNQLIPDIVKPGTELKIVGSSLNQLNLTVAPILEFRTIYNETYFGTASQVMYNNTIYECIQAYTQSFVDGAETRFFTPETSTSVWRRSRFVRVEQLTYAEILTKAQLYLTTDKLYFTQAFTQSSAVTLASAVSNYATDFKSLNIDLYYEKGLINAHLLYPSMYAEVKFYKGDPKGDMYFAGASFSEFGKTLQTNERLVEVKEKLNYELNYDISENFKYNIVFTDLDEKGIKIVINKEVYEEQAALIYTGGYIDIERTIDRTLRLWLERNYLRLFLLGIIAELEYIGSVSSQFFNSIVLKTEYPNVPFIVNRVEVGSSADFYIEHSRILFKGKESIGPNLKININGKDYEQQTIYGTYLDSLGNIVSATSASASVKLPDIPATLAAWVDEHGEFLQSDGLYITNINNMLKLDTKSVDKQYVYTVNSGKVNIPGQNEVIITHKTKGSHGTLITSNQVVLPQGSSGSFTDVGFATGMVFSVNNTIYPFNNQEFNVQYVDGNKINLSYQGPFWGLTDSLCNASPYVTIAFNSGFGQTACVSYQGITGEGSPFDLDQFNNNSFTKYKFSTVYLNQSLPLGTVPGSNNMVDIKYIGLAESIFILSTNLIVMDAAKYEYTTYVVLTGNSNPIKLEYNDYNNYLYCLSKNKLYAVDPILNILMTTITLTNDAYDIIINPTNGDIYISYSNSPTISVYDWTNNLVATITTPAVGDTKTGKMVWNAFQEDVYVTTDGDYVLRINGSDRSIQTSYNVPGLQTDGIFYDPVNEAVYVWDSTNLNKIYNGSVISIGAVGYSSPSTMVFNNLTGELNVSNSTGFTSLELDTDTISYTQNFSEYGNMVLNQYDGMIYMSSDNSAIVTTINPNNGWVIHNEPTTTNCTKIIYNPLRKSVWTIQPTPKAVFELTPQIDTKITQNKQTGINIDESRYGTLADEYKERENVWLKTREYVRKPRENFEGEQPVEYYWEWYDDQSPEFFMYDTNGEQLERTTTGSYSYTGPIPLGDVPLNKLPNRDLTKTTMPEYQQTVFDQIYQTLDYINSSEVISSAPSALEMYVGFKSTEEGPKEAVLQLYKRENVSFDISSTVTNNTIVSFRTIIHTDGTRVGEIRLNVLSDQFFINRGLKPGQIISLNIVDTTNLTNQYNSYNTGSIFSIRNVFAKTIIVDFFEAVDVLDTEETIVTDWPNTGNKTYLKCTFNVIDREIARFFLYAQTEIEDIRYKINLTNIGKNIETNHTFIFKEYDIQEGGVDWKYLNTKRKEMLMNKNLIYHYIGAYKSIINAINFFGYNDLKLNEYYRNKIPSSRDFNKLFKIEIPDIFDNSVDGWTENDFLKHSFPNENFEETKLMNLTFDITDKEGTNILEYTIEEVTIKLQGLKTWLTKNIIPLTHKILDITGRAHFNSSGQIRHKVNDVRIFNIREDMTPVTFKLNEAYLLPVNSGSTVYNCVLDFYSIIPGTGEDKPIIENPPYPDRVSMPMMDPEGYRPKPVLPEYYTIKIRTYKTYKEWAPFTTYNIGDRVIYYDKLYESTMKTNKINNPRKYEDAQEWTSGNYYSVTDLVKYKRRVYTYSGLGTQDQETPPLFNQGDLKDWLDVTEWIEVDYDPIQTIKEFRNTKPPYPAGLSHSTPWPLLPFNFTVDSNLDPFIVVEVTSENGYGATFTDRKNYEIRGVKDLTDRVIPLEKIGPFVPITPL